jgi:hypothetical protein
VDTFENIARVARKQPDASHFTTREVKRKADAPRLLGFQIPHEGSSYRPTAASQRDLLAQAIASEQDRLENNAVHRVKLAGGYGSTVIPDDSLLEDNSKQQNLALESKEGTVTSELAGGSVGEDGALTAAEGGGGAELEVDDDANKVGYGPAVENKKKTKAQVCSLRYITAVCHRSAVISLTHSLSLYYGTAAQQGQEAEGRRAGAGGCQGGEGVQEPTQPDWLHQKASGRVPGRAGR